MKNIFIIISGISFMLLGLLVTRGYVLSVEKQAILCFSLGLIMILGEIKELLD